MEDTSPKVLNLTEAIQIQQDAVISRTLVNQPAGTITLFGFDKGQGLSEHAAPFDAMVVGLEGEAEIRISGQPYSIHPGESIVMPANHPHALNAITPFKMMLVMIKG
jgi:quercetin dioxygenase-like cupin family protein